MLSCSNVLDNSRNILVNISFIFSYNSHKFNQYSDFFSIEVLQPQRFQVSDAKGGLGDYGSSVTFIKSNEFYSQNLE